MTTPIVLPDSNNLKRCARCREWKPLEAFSRNATLPDGLQRRCKACNAAHYAEHREERTAYKRKNADGIRLYLAQYYVDNREELEKYYALYRANHREENRKRSSDWAKNNPDKNRDKAERRRARKAGASGSYTTADIEAIRVAQGNRCYLCGKTLKKYHIDHFIPLALGGSNDPGNLRLACPSCNLRKHAKHPFELGVLL
jgi:5-methylcytosine-specific restriction endonuclease McrA